MRVILRLLRFTRPAAAVAAAQAQQHELQQQQRPNSLDDVLLQCGGDADALAASPTPTPSATPTLFPTPQLLSAFLSLSDAASSSPTKAELLASVAHIVQAKASSSSCGVAGAAGGDASDWTLVDGALDGALLAVRRAEGESLYALLDEGDIQAALSDSCELWVLLHDDLTPTGDGGNSSSSSSSSNSSSSPADRHAGAGDDVCPDGDTLLALHGALPRPARSAAARTKAHPRPACSLASDWDTVYMPCTVEREAGGVWRSEELRQRAECAEVAAAHTEESATGGACVADAAVLDSSAAYSVQLRASFAANGFVRVRLDPELLGAVRALQAMQARFFALPPDVKARYSLQRRTGHAARYQPPIGYVSTSASREYYVVRQPPCEDELLQSHCRLPSELPFAERVWPVFHELGRLAQSIARLLLRSFDVAQADIDAALQGTMDPALDAATFGHSSVLELFLYQARSSASLPCAIHTDASLLTLIPRSVGAAGLEIWNWAASGWQAVEAQAADDECVVFAGDMLQRLLRGGIQAAQHRVRFDQVAGVDRYSTPFELFAHPQYVIDCRTLLARSWQHFPHCEPAALPAPYCQVETALAAANWFSKGLVSVNMND